MMVFAFQFTLRVLAEDFSVYCETEYASIYFLLDISDISLLGSSFS